MIGAFPIEANDQIVLVTDTGQLIREPVDDIRIAGRRTQGVTLFDVEGDERVTSISRLQDVDDDDVEGLDGDDVDEVHVDELPDEDAGDAAD